MIIALNASFCHFASLYCLEVWACRYPSRLCPAIGAPFSIGRLLRLGCRRLFRSLCISEGHACRLRLSRSRWSCTSQSYKSLSCRFDNQYLRAICRFYLFQLAGNGVILGWYSTLTGSDSPEEVSGLSSLIRCQTWNFNRKKSIGTSGVSEYGYFSGLSFVRALYIDCQFIWIIIWLQNSNWYWVWTRLWNQNLRRTESATEILWSRLRNYSWKWNGACRRSLEWRTARDLVALPIENSEQLDYFQLPGLISICGNLFQFCLFHGRTCFLVRGALKESLINHPWRRPPGKSDCWHFGVLFRLPIPDHYRFRLWYRLQFAWVSAGWSKRLPLRPLPSPCCCLHVTLPQSFRASCAASQTPRPCEAALEFADSFKWISLRTRLMVMLLYYFIV